MNIYNIQSKYFSLNNFNNIYSSGKIIIQLCNSNNLITFFPSRQEVPTDSMKKRILEFLQNNTLNNSNHKS